MLRYRILKLRGDCWLSLFLLTLIFGLILRVISLCRETINHESLLKAPAGDVEPFSLLLIVLGHSRPSSLQRLLNSLSKVEWFQSRVDLRIWIDRGSPKDSLRVAKGFIWSHGSKIVRIRKVHYGLLKSWLQAWPIWDRHDYALILEDDLEIHPQVYQAFRYLTSKIGSREVDGVIFQRLQDIPCGSFVHFASSWAPVFSRRLFHDFVGWYNARRTCVPDFEPFVPGHEKTYNHWLRERRDVWSPWLRRYLYEKGTVFLYAGSLGMVHNHHERGSHQTEAPAFFVHRKIWPKIEWNRIQECVLQKPPVFECNNTQDGVQCGPVDGDRRALLHRGIKGFFGDKLWICGAPRAA